MESFRGIGESVRRDKSSC